MTTEPAVQQTQKEDIPPREEESGAGNAEYRFFPLIFRQKYIRRWGLMHSVIPESLSEHSMETAVIAHALAVIGRRIFHRQYDPAKIALLALFHDAPEVYTGDLPTPVKYFDENIRTSYATIERRAVETLLEKLPEALREEYRDIFAGGSEEEHRLVKAADKLCAYIKCIEEEKGGNVEFRSAKRSLGKILSGMDCPELHYFMEQLLPAFSLTVDELQL